MQHTISHTDRISAFFNSRSISMTRIEILNANSPQANNAESLSNLKIDANSSMAKMESKSSREALGVKNLVCCAASDRFYYSCFQGGLSERHLDHATSLLFNHKTTINDSETKISKILAHEFANHEDQKASSSRKIFDDPEDSDSAADARTDSILSSESIPRNTFNNDEGVHIADCARLLTSMSDQSPSSQVLPAAQFCDSLVVRRLATTRLANFENPLEYKNNLSTTIRATSGKDYLLVCRRTQVMVYQFDECSNCPKGDAYIIETRPSITTRADRIASTLPTSPHTLNFIKVGADWVEGPVVMICGDDGRILVWNVEKLLWRLQTADTKANAFHFETTMPPDLSLKLNSSTWGADIKTAHDAYGHRHQILAASANDRCITLFHCINNSKNIFKVKTHQLSHNIPEVTILDYTISGLTHRAYLSCVSISGELVVFECVFQATSKVLERHEYGLNFEFKSPVVIRRSCLDADCWTTKAVHERYFKRVSSLESMTGDHIDENVEVSRISVESEIVSFGTRYSKMAGLGYASRLQFFRSPVMDLATSGRKCEEGGNPVKFHSFQEECERACLDLTLMESDNLEKKGLDKTFLLVSTEKRLGLFRADTLICAAATKAPFNILLPVCEEKTWCNRISITTVIPELSLFVAVTQMGLMTLMRLCEYRGVFGMRQEYVFPRAGDFNSQENASRTVLGLSVRDLSISPANPRFSLHLIYSDGLVLSILLEQSAEGFSYI